MTTRTSPRSRNLELRRARHALRLSQAEFAEALRAAGNAVGEPNGCTKRLIQKWENGEHTNCRPSYRKVLEVVTGLPADELGFEQPPGIQGATASESGNAVTSETRTLPAGDGAVSPAGPVASPAAHDMAAYYSDPMVKDSMDRLRHALNHPSTVDARVAEFVEMATTRLFDLDHHSPARLLARTVDRHLATVTALLNAAQAEKVRRRLTVAAGRAALLAGWLAFDLGDTTSSHGFWADALAAAQGTTDDALFAAVLTFQSYAAARGGDLRTAWQLGHTAASRTPDEPRATAWTTARVALYAAKLGEHKAGHVAMERSLELGRHLPNPMPGIAASPWTRSFDSARLLSTTAHTAALLKDPEAAEYATQAVDALAPATVKSRAVVLAEAALTAALVGDLELCLDYSCAALTLIRSLDVSVAAELLREVIPIVMPHSDTRPVRELLPQLSCLIQAETGSVATGRAPWARAEVLSDQPARTSTDST